jgi:hypothetical protein
MDRQTIYSGQLPRTVDLLQTQQNMMVALAKLSQSVLGTPTIVDGFTCTPTAPTATMNVILTPGTLYQLENLEQSAWSSLPAITSASIIKQGIQLAPVTLTLPGAPSTIGYSQFYLLELAYQDLDGGSLVLPYYNAANPQANFSGPANDGLAQNTIRQGAVAYQLKAGVAAPTSTATVPSADPGYIGVFAIELSYGQTTITSGSITNVIGAMPALPTANMPFIPVTLPQVPVSSQAGLWTYAADTSLGAQFATSGTTSTSSAVLSLSAVTNIVVGMKAFDITTPGAIVSAQTVLSINTGAHTVTLSANVDAAVGNGDTIAFATNLLVANPFYPPISTLIVGMALRVKLAHANTGPLTLDVGTGANPVVRANMSACVGGDFPLNAVLDLVWDGSHWQVMNYFGPLGGGSSITNNYYSGGGIPYCADTSVTANLITAPFNPAITTPTAGLVVVVKLANTVTGATTITVNALGAVAVVNQLLQPLTAGVAVAGEMLIMTYTGTVWQIFVAGLGVVISPPGFASYVDLIGSAPGNTKTASWTVGELIAENILGGTAYKGANLSLSFNGGGTGANGMDTGATPISADVSVYAIFNPGTSTWSTLGCAGTTSNGRVYAGANMPAGYVASCLIWSGKADGSGNLGQFVQCNSNIDIVPNQIFNNVTAPLVGGQSTYAGQGISGAVPANARFAKGLLENDFGPSTTPTGVSSVPTAYANPMGTVFVPTGLGAQWGNSGFLFFIDLRLATAQTVYWMGPPGSANAMWVSGYRI